jgi:hypothetical protein
VLLPCLWFSACGGGGSGSVTLQELGPKAVSSLCAFEVRCGLYPDQTTCAGATATNLSQITADVSAGTIQYDAAAASDCLNAFASLGCNRSDQPDKTPQSCSDAFKGTIADGAACFINQECVSQKCNVGSCAQGAMCCQGTCGATVPPIPAGGDCSGQSSSCVGGTFCQTGAGATSATCAARVAEGQPCMSVDECLVGLACHFDAATASGVCERFPAEGETCDPTQLGCNASTDFCDQATKKCVHDLAVGDPCPSGNGCVSYARCDTARMVCVARGAVGGPCASQSDCLGSLACTNGACALKAPAPVCP